MLIEKSIKDQCSEVLRWPTPRSKRWVTDYVESAYTDPNILAIVAVGSAVRPNVPSVDVDLIVISSDTTQIDRTAPIEVDLRTYSVANIDDQIKARHDMLIWAVLFGKALYQLDSFWERLVNKWSQRLPLPSIELASSRALATYDRLEKILETGDDNAVAEQALTLFTHLARMALIEKGIFPASRPELSVQLREIGNDDLAGVIHGLYVGTITKLSDIKQLIRAWGPLLQSTNQGTTAK